MVWASFVPLVLTLTLKELRGQLIRLSSSPGSDDGKYDAEFKKIGAEIDAIKQMLEQEEQRGKHESNMSAELDDILQTMSAGSLSVTEYDDTLVRKLIECVKVKSAAEITVIFKGGVTVTVGL